MNKERQLCYEKGPIEGLLIDLIEKYGFAKLRKR